MLRHFPAGFDGGEECVHCTFPLLGHIVFYLSRHPHFSLGVYHCLWREVRFLISMCSRVFAFGGEADNDKSSVLATSRTNYKQRKEGKSIRGEEDRKERATLGNIEVGKQRRRRERVKGGLGFASQCYTQTHWASLAPSNRLKSTLFSNLLLSSPPLP